MTKKILAMLLAVVLCVSALPLGIYAEETETSCTHTYVDSVCSLCGAECPHTNSTWDVAPGDVHDQYCYDCKRPVTTGAAHTFENGVCTACGTPECEHTLKWVDNNGCHARQCETCEVVVTQWEAHTDTDTDNKCDVCSTATGTTSGCTHEKTAWAVVPGDLHYQHCADCDQPLTTEAGHDFVDGVCTVCDKAYCPHMNREWKVEDGKCACWCKDCEVLFLDWKNHYDTDGNGQCDECGTVYDATTGCTHDRTSWIAIGGDQHLQSCDDCGGILIGGEDHNFKNDVCTLCGVTYCAHAGWKWETNSREHTKKCDGCGRYITAWYLHADTNSDGLCDECEITWSCSHTSTVWATTTGDLHYQRCTNCGKAMTDPAEHTFVDDVCTECSKIYCAHTTNWEWITDSLEHAKLCHACNVYTVVESHYDNDGNGKCDECGVDWVCTHTSAWTTTHYNHSSSCATCGDTITATENHVDANSDGTCDKCSATGIHTWKAVAEVPATCAAEGKKAHYTCDGCKLLWTEMVSNPSADNDVDAATLVIVKAAHTYADSMSCSVCSTGCAHATWNWVENRGMHAKQCSAGCGFVFIDWEPHVSEDGDDVCDVCGKTFVSSTECAHTNTAWAVVQGDLHWQYCVDCSVTLVDNEPHTYNENGICTACGKEKCKHTNYTWQQGDDTHRKFCTACQLPVTDWERHGDTNKDGKCDVCNAAWPCTHNYVNGSCTLCNAKDPVDVTVEKKDDVPQVSVSIPTQELLTEADKAAIEEGKKVEIALTVENADKTVAPEEKATVEQAVAQLNTEASANPSQGDAPAPETKVGMYLDINLIKTVGEAETAVTETDAPIGITVSVPTDLKNTDENVNREFSVLRLHEGVSTILKDIDNNPDTVTFETDQFSTYVLLYSDITKQDVPTVPAETQPEATEKPDSSNAETGDNSHITLFVSLMLLSLVAIAAALVLANRKPGKYQHR